MLAEGLILCVWLDAHRVPRGVHGGEDGRCPSLVTSGGHGDSEQIQAPGREVSVAELQRAGGPEQGGRGAARPAGGAWKNFWVGGLT